jgi:hypothetical protein
MALTKVLTGGLALDAVDNTILKLDDDYALTGTVSGAGYDLLLSDTISSTVAQYDISSTYINGTYNSYYLEASLLPETDEVYLNSQVFVGGVVQTDSIYAYEGQRIGGATWWCKL